MRFQKSGNSFLSILVAIAIIFCIVPEALGMNVRNQTGKRPLRNSNSIKPISESRQFGGETNFQNWKIWDRPEDQLAIESMNLGNSYHRQTQQARTKKLLHRNNTVPAEVAYFHDPSTAKQSTGGSNSNGMQRNDCNSNLQVSFLPVILAIIAVVAGVIGIIILWFIAKSFQSTGGSNVGYGAPSGGWSSKRSDPFGFAKNFKDFDFNQLTDIVLKGIEQYKGLTETISSSKKIK